MDEPVVTIDGDRLKVTVTYSADLPFWGETDKYSAVGHVAKFTVDERKLYAQGVTIEPYKSNGSKIGRAMKFARDLVDRRITRAVESSVLHQFTDEELKDLPSGIELRSVTPRDGKLYAVVGMAGD